MARKDARATHSLGTCLAAPIAAGVVGNAQAAPETARVIVAFKPGAAAT